MGNGTPGPVRFWSECVVCPPLAYDTPEIAADKTALHRAMCRDAGGCAASVHPGRLERFQRRGGDDDG